MAENRNRKPEDGLSRMVCLTMAPPSGKDPADDQARVLRALRGSGGISEQVSFNLQALRSLHHACLAGNWRITLTFAWNGNQWVIVRVQPGDRSGEHYGYAVDLGSTSVVLRLIDCGSRKVVVQKSAYNRQIRFGEDILSRIFYCRDSPEKLDEIRQETVRTIRDLMEQAQQDMSSGTQPEEDFQGVSMVVAGNTTMVHFLLGLDPFAVFAEPNAVCSLSPGFFPGRDLGLPLPGYVFCVPGRANYVGGDIVSGMVATDMFRQEGISVFFDIGTNGELVAGSRDFLICGAGAAGPALEGGSVSTGMRAAPGAIDEVRLRDGHFQVHIIGENGPAAGICGSGIVDLLSELFMNGWVDLTGRLQPEKSPLICLVNTEDESQEYAVFYTDTLSFTQSDIREFIRTKAAAVTMMDTMLSAAGIEPGDVEHFYMAGSFGIHVNKESAICIGMYPDVAREKIVQAGNTSLEGARKILLDRSLLEELPRIISNMDYLAFAQMGDFPERMRAAMALPHTDLNRYPSVARKLRSGAG